MLCVEIIVLEWVSWDECNDIELVLFVSSINCQLSTSILYMEEVILEPYIAWLRITIVLKITGCKKIRRRRRFWLYMPHTWKLSQHRQPSCKQSINVWVSSPINVIIGRRKHSTQSKAIMKIRYVSWNSTFMAEEGELWYANTTGFCWRVFLLVDRNYVYNFWEGQIVWQVRGI